MSSICPHRERFTGGGSSSLTNTSARLLQKYHWITYVGLAVILYVAIEMIYRGAMEVWPTISAG
jgi:predicted tellurium resistance membrane protein TerC